MCVCVCVRARARVCVCVCARMCVRMHPQFMVFVLILLPVCTQYAIDNLTSNDSCIYTVKMKMTISIDITAP